MRQASEADPQATLPVILLAKIYIEAGKLPEAERLSAELKTRAPEDPDGYGALAFFYETTGQKEKAAAELKVAFSTVNFHMQNIYGKLQVHSKSEAVSKALRQRIVK